MFSHTRIQDTTTRTYIHVTNIVFEHADTSDDLEYGLLHLSLLDTEYIFSLHILGKMISNSNYVQMLAIVLLEDIAFSA